MADDDRQIRPFAAWLTEQRGGSTHAQAIIDAALASAEPKVLDPEELYLTSGEHVDVHDLEQYLDRPRRKRGLVDLHTGAALGAYVQNHDGEGTALYADTYDRTIVALLNGHDTDAGWGDHRARLKLRHTPEWAAWAGADKKLVGQVDFAELIEDRLDDIVSPAGADLLELAKTFEAKTNVEFASGIVLESGQRQLTYKETIDARAGAQGQITIPKEIELGIAPFEGSDRYKVVARLRYRINGGALTIGIQLIRAEEVLRSAFADILSTVEKLTDRTAYLGLPPT